MSHSEEEREEEEFDDDDDSKSMSCSDSDSDLDSDSGSILGSDTDGTSVAGNGGLDEDKMEVEDYDAVPTGSKRGKGLHVDDGSPKRIRMT
ncbi:hypothetical protein Moror_13739 [Moniliophthora roreri MCA 2997]|uniref:Uncharacterized protein n=1 Tax=Moniliophthora roreri (strain MCA 2997) TaxID=1381753 RepID=V2XCU0_MONRO|nr:hypothetical protein Moror_13739 [Moniliophthora roreri MCA 2997]